MLLGVVVMCVFVFTTAADKLIVTRGDIQRPFVLCAGDVPVWRGCMFAALLLAEVAVRDVRLLSVKYTAYRPSRGQIDALVGGE